MNRSQKTTKDIMMWVAETLRTANQGLEDVKSHDPKRKLGDLRNLIVFGRAVTNVLQNLRSTEPEFENWYKPWVEEMSTDELLQFFYKLRTEILKEGSLPTSSILHVHHIELPKDLLRFGPPPQGAKGFFMGDQVGGSGWEIELPDGTTEKFYVNLPSDIATSSVEMPTAPRKHLSKVIVDISIESLSQHYLDYMAKIVKAAKNRFKHKL